MSKEVILRNSLEKSIAERQAYYDKNKPNTEQIRSTTVLSRVLRMAVLFGGFLPLTWRYQLSKIKFKLFGSLSISETAPHSLKFWSENHSLFNDSFKKLFKLRVSKSSDIVLFSIVDWEFRKQRPQHLAINFAEKGKRVIYLQPHFIPMQTPGYIFVPSGVDGVSVLYLGGRRPDFGIHDTSFGLDDLDFFQKSLTKLIEELSLKQKLAIIHHPFWWQLVTRVQGFFTIYDCLDHLAGFTNSSSLAISLERDMIENADKVVVTAEYLKTNIEPQRQDVSIIRNAADVSYFNQVKKSDEAKFTVGYIGAVSEWFDSELLEVLLSNYPQWQFSIVGAVENKHVLALARYPNLTLHGEVAYTNLLPLMSKFSVGIIPFKLNELTRCTNPVKVYEYLAAGLSVVATNLPELQSLREHVRIASNHYEFCSALRELQQQPSNKALVLARKQFVACHSWQNRAEKFLENANELGS